LRFRIRAQSHEDPDSPLPLALLCLHRERPRRRRAAEKRDERAPSHCLSREPEPGIERFNLAHFNKLGVTSGAGQVLSGWPTSASGLKGELNDQIFNVRSSKRASTYQPTA
jgi:hypothetical protein